MLTNKSTDPIKTRLSFPPKNQRGKKIIRQFADNPLDEVDKGGAFKARQFKGKKNVSPPSSPPRESEEDSTEIEFLKRNKREGDER